MATDIRVGRIPAGRFVVPVMTRARKLWRNKVAAELAFITGRSVRTAERWLAGEVTPDGESTLALIFSEIGPKVIEAGVAQLSPERQIAFWDELERARQRALIRARNEARR